MIAGLLPSGASLKSNRLEQFFISRWFFLTVCAGIFLLPAIAGLAGEVWQSEAGSLAPLILCLGGWTLWNGVRDNRDLVEAGSMAIWAPPMGVACLVYLYASAIGMVSLMALAAWLGCMASFYALFGARMVRKCLFPILFMGLVVPLPYSLSVQMNAGLRGSISESAVALGSRLGMDVALEHGAIIVGPYVLAVENACAGVSSTASLVAIGLLFAYWIGRANWKRMVAVGLLAIPIALLANVLRVVFLMQMVSMFGTGLLDTSAHPLAGVASFVLALTLLLGASALLSRLARLRIGFHD